MIKIIKPDLKCNSNTGSKLKAISPNIKDSNSDTKQNQDKCQCARSIESDDCLIRYGSFSFTVNCLKKFIDEGGNLKNRLKAIKRGEMCLS